jgi:hypothetical protein
VKELITDKNFDTIKINEKTKDLFLTIVHLIGNNKKALDTYWCVMVNDVTLHPKLSRKY